MGSGDYSLQVARASSEMDLTLKAGDTHAMMCIGITGPTPVRLVELCETPQGRQTWSKRPGPAAAALAFTVLFLGIVSGATLIYRGQDALGLMAIVVPMIFTALLVVWVVRAPRK